MIHSFSDFELDTQLQELRKAGIARTIEPQVFDLLRYLIENRNRLVSRDELFEKVWKGRIVSDATLSNRIKAARRAVDDTGKAQSVIKTVPRRGFRFVADVRIDPGPVASTVTTDPGDAPKAASRAETGPSGVREATGGPASPDATDRRYPPLPDQPAIAVLPFANLGGDADQEYFSDGITEDILTVLSNVQAFLVIDRTSSFNYKNRGADVRTVGRELGVHYMLEGSVRRSGRRVRVSAQLVDAVTSHHVWAGRFDATLDEIFDLQDDIASSVIGAIEPELLRVEVRRVGTKQPEDLEAYDLTLQGLS